MRRVLYIFFMVFSLKTSVLEAKQPLVCIHGILGAPWNMHLYAKNFARKGFIVTNWGYPSREKNIEEHGANLAQELKKIARQNPGEPIYFLGHSMGCLVIRSALNHPDCPKEAKIGRAVLLAPPNKGSTYARFLNSFSFPRWIAQDWAGKQLFTKKNFDYLGEFPDTMDKVMVIAGTFGLNPFIKGDNDGSVAVEETKLNTPHKLVTINRGHHTIVMSKDVYGLALNFFKN